MAAKPSFCRDLPLGIALLQQGSEEWVGRRELESALGVSKTVAWRLMRECGAKPGPGDALVCRRNELITALERMRDGNGRVGFEVRRRERVAAYLEQIRPDVIANRTHLVAAAEAPRLVASRLATLPANVSLRPGRLEIDFAGTEEFLAAIGAVVYALKNDYEAVASFLDRSEAV